MGKASSILIAAALLFLHQAQAMIFMGSGDPEKNTSPPTGPLAGSGWELHGKFGNFTGIPIGPHHFIAAKHIGAAGAFVWNGVTYTIVSTAIDSQSDLRIFEVRETFPTFAPLYDGPSEIGAPLVVFGRGARRGAEVFLGGELRGWMWGAWDMRMRWGTNVVTDIINDNPEGGSSEVLQIDFNADGGDDEAHLAVGDSSGGVFIKHDGQWRLAGVNFTVDGPYSTTPSGAGFVAALFRHDGFFAGGENEWKLITPLTPIGSFYATRIKARLAWIQSALEMPTTPTLVRASTPEGPFAIVENATIDSVAKTIRISIEEGNAFLQLQSSVAREIVSIKREGNLTLVIEYR